ncbi:MAG: nucleoside-diphosphate kinase [Candidatus Latescibacteria bacterium]|mgnify:CR=1 FL=1|jgi:nucleoside-diphosphate kinase|nr:nucleoside-diphosphate kinase [Candidatus Latescibacterota bacterium]
MADRTLMIIKPDAVSRNAVGTILAHVEKEGFRILQMVMMHLTRAQAAEFYAVHREKPFYSGLLDFMTSGSSVPLVLEREEAVPKLREVVGATNSAEAAEGTIRRTHGTNVQENAVHASDSPENAAKEVAFFFGEGALS